MNKAKKLFIKTYGCQMNVYDSERIADLLVPHGYTLTDKPEGADVAILNTCHIREKATEKVFSDLGRLRPFKEDKKKKAEKGNENNTMILAVAGCTAQAEGAEITRRAPYVDLVIGPQMYHRLPEFLARHQDQKKDKKSVIETDFPVESKFDFLPEQREISASATAFLTIQEGCDKFCTFCCVPYTRGMEFSRPVKAIIQEAKHLATLGAKEITLLGQNVNAYHGEALTGKGEWGLGRLIKELANIPELQRIRYTTSHPRDVDEELIEAHRDIPQLMPFLHLPVQSGSDRILKMMNRGHTHAFYREIIEKFRKARPDMAFSSDFIVGFPGESDEDFADTLNLVNDIDYAQAFSFAYSPRQGTPASIMKDQISEKGKQTRLYVLQELLKAQQSRFNTSCIESTYPVLFEKKGKYENQYIGRSPYLQLVHVYSEECLLGKLLPVQIKNIHTNSLEGVLVA